MLGKFGIDCARTVKGRNERLRSIGWKLPQRRSRSNGTYRVIKTGETLPYRSVPYVGLGWPIARVDDSFVRAARRRDRRIQEECCPVNSDNRQQSRWRSVSNYSIRTYNEGEMRQGFVVLICRVHICDLLTSRLLVMRCGGGPVAFSSNRTHQSQTLSNGQRMR